MYYPIPTILQNINKWTFITDIYFDKYAYLQGCGRTSSLAWRVYTRNIRDYVVVPHYSRARHVHIRGHGPLCSCGAFTPLQDLSPSPLRGVK